MVAIWGSAENNDRVPRASDDTREHTVSVLREGLLSGRLGLDTFVGRLDETYDAKTHAELSRVTYDLAERPTRWARFVEWLRGEQPSTGEIRVLRPPSKTDVSELIVGRDAECSYCVGDATVSSRHAALQYGPDGWRVRDLESRNGTRVNGWRVDDHPLHDGDEIAFGAAEFVFREPRS